MSENPTTSTPTPGRVVNIDLLDRALARIDANPEKWTQREWRCETGMCLAGWVAAVAGASWELPDTPDHDYVLDPVTGESLHVSRYAQDALGVNGDQRHVLFRGMNERVELQAMRDVLAQDPDATFAQLADAADVAYRAWADAQGPQR